MVEVKEFKSWIESDVGHRYLKMVFSMTGCSAVDALDKVSELYMLQPELSMWSKDEISIQLPRRDIYRLMKSTFPEGAPQLIAKGSSRFGEGKMKASLVYYEQQFDVIESEQAIMEIQEIRRKQVTEEAQDTAEIRKRQEHQEIRRRQENQKLGELQKKLKKHEKNESDFREKVVIPFLYERHTGLMFSTLILESNKNTVRNFIDKTLQALQSGMISPYQKKIEIENLFLPRRILQFYEAPNKTLTSEGRYEFKTPEQEIARELKLKNRPLSKKFKVQEWDPSEDITPIRLDYTEKKLRGVLSFWLRNLNQKELDNIAVVTDRERQFKVKMDKLFPVFKRVMRSSKFKDWNPS